MNLADVLEELVEERGLDRATLNNVLSEGILAAYQRKYPDLPLKAEYDPIDGAVRVFVGKEVVSSVQNDAVQISLKKAVSIKSSAQEGDILWLPFEGKVGRIEILRARQVIASKIREVEASSVYNEFKDREGEIILGVVYKCERSGVVVKVDDIFAFLPKSLCLSNDKWVVGAPVRALLKEVLMEPRNDNQLILDRTSERFLQQLFELEIPEVFERLIEIKKIARISGYKTKIVVASSDKNIDPVGTCVGVGGGRIRPILKELGGEKIDVLPWSNNPEDMVLNALKPAKINRVVCENGIARVWLDDDQRSLAIGKMGQNIMLASKVVGLEIQLMPSGGSMTHPGFEDDTFL